MPPSPSKLQEAATASNGGNMARTEVKGQPSTKEMEPQVWLSVCWLPVRCVTHAAFPLLAFSPKTKATLGAEEQDVRCPSP